MRPARWSSPARALHHGLLLLVLAAGAGLAAAGLGLLFAGSYGLRGTPAFAPLVGGLAASLLVGLAVFVGRVAAWRRGAWSGTSGASLRVFVYCGVLGSVVYLLGFQPFKAFHLLLFLGVQSGVFALLVGVGYALPRVTRSGAVRLADRLALALTIAVLGLELGLRAASRVSSSPLLARGDAGVREQLRRYRFPPGRRVGGMQCDARGYYDVELEDDAELRLIASIGDSFSTGPVPHYYHYTTVAERELAAAGAPPTALYNMGVNACGPAEYLVMLAEDALPLEPEEILIALFLGNDVIEARRFAPGHALLRWWYDADNYLTALLPTRLRRLNAGVETDSDDTEHDRRDWEHDLLIEQAPKALAPHFPWLADPRLEAPTFTREAFLRIEAFRAREACDPSRRGAYRGFFEALEAIVRRAGDTPLRFLLIPDEFQVEDALWAELLSHPYVQPLQAHPASTLDRNRPQTLTRAWLDERNLPYLDLLPILRSTAPLEDGDRHLYRKQDTHLNARGNELVGRALAEFLR